MFAFELVTLADVGWGLGRKRIVMVSIVLQGPEVEKRKDP